MSAFDSGGKKANRKGTTWEAWREAGLPTGGTPLFRSIIGGAGRLHDANYVVPRIQRHLDLHPEPADGYGVQRKATASGGAQGVHIPASGGTALPNAVQSKMGQKLGTDLSDVTVHTSGDSAKASEDLNAKAFTVGTDVHFNSGQFDPDSKEGEKLLAHELTHVAQNKQGGIHRKQDDATEVSSPDDPEEMEADEKAEEIVDEKEADPVENEGVERKASRKKLSRTTNPNAPSSSNGAVANTPSAPSTNPSASSSSHGTSPQATGTNAASGAATPVPAPPKPKIAKSLVSGGAASVDGIDGALYVDLAGVDQPVSVSANAGTPEAETKQTIDAGGTYDEAGEKSTLKAVAPAPLKSAASSNAIAQSVAEQTGTTKVEIAPSGAGFKAKAKLTQTDWVELGALYLKDLQTNCPNDKWFSKDELGAFIGLSGADLDKIIQLWKQPSPKWTNTLKSVGHAAGVSYTFDLTARDQRNPEKVRAEAETRFGALVESPLWIGKVHKYAEPVGEGTRKDLTDYQFTAPKAPVVDWAVQQTDKIPPYPVTNATTWKQLFTTEGIKQEEGDTKVYSLHQEFNGKVGEIFVKDVQDWAKHMIDSPNSVALQKLDGVIYHNNSDVGNIEMPGGDEVDPDLKAAVPSGTGEDAPIFEFMKKMAQHGTHAGYSYKMFQKAMEKGPNKTYLAGKVRDAYRAAEGAEGAGAHEWFPSEMFTLAISKAADIIMDGEVATTDIKKLNMGFAWIELQHDLRTETYRIIFNKSIMQDEPSDPTNPTASVKKPMLQGHSGAIEGPRNPMKNEDYIPQNSFQNGSGSFHEGLKTAFGSSDDITKVQGEVEKHVNDWSWKGGDVHKYCRMQTGPNAGKQPTQSDATDGLAACLADIASGFSKAIAKLSAA